MLNNQKSLENESKVNILNKKKQISNRHVSEKIQLKQNFKNLEFKSKNEYNKSLRKIKKSKNKKLYLKTKLNFQRNKINIELDFREKLNKLKITQKKELNDLKISLQNTQNPIFLDNNKDKTARLLNEKNKNKNKNKNLIKEKTDYKQVFKNLPIRLSKEVKRIRWGSQDAQIFLKFFQVLLFIVICALLLWGIESALTALLKVMKISAF